MNRSQLKKTGLFGAICGSLVVGLAAIPETAKAQTTTGALNPCPGLYYEEPFASLVTPPAGCPANAASQRQLRTPNEAAQRLRTPDDPDYNRLGLPGANQSPQAVRPADAMTTEPYQAAQPGAIEQPARPPLPENRSEPVARVMPMGNRVDIQLMNETNTIITYEVTGETSRRVLPGGESATLQNITLPATVTAVRQDDGFVEITPMTTDEGMITFSLDEDATPLDARQGVIRIQEDGKIFIN